MGSAFMPLKPGTASPMPLTSGVKHTPRGKPFHPKRTRQGSSLKQMMILDDIDETTPPDNISVSASEASTKGSNHSQPPILDFVGAACFASSWFTSCFPCAILDINDNDNLVIDKLSRESAMNVMYSNNFGDNKKYQDSHREKDSNVIFVRLPEQEKSDIPHNYSIPSVIVEDSDEDEAIDSMSLNDDSDNMPIVIIPSVQKVSPPKKKRFGMKKLFGRKRQ
ncbi:hypothetical protein ACHAW5_000329 [Stephanodiscus triporus]|uniref:Uncharacterized protein n=1 Tax=Stephanodiscus triporus TaxID=2934178 RepID=A0ABD3PAG2_9STRA